MHLLQTNLSVPTSGTLVTHRSQKSNFPHSVHLKDPSALTGLPGRACDSFYRRTHQGLQKQDQIRALLGIPADAKVIEVMTLGYPADHPRPKSRKPMKELISYDQW
jgi:hypothetical protein